MFAPHPARPPERVTREGRYALIEPVDAARHGAAIWAGGLEDPAVWTYMGYGPFDGEAAFVAWLKTREALADPLSFAVVDKASGRALGVATLMEIRPEHGVIEVGHIVFSPALQRTRAATEAIFLLGRYVFDELGNRRFEWKCNNANAPSKRAALRLGFRFEGVFRNHMIVKGRNRDTAWFAMTDDDWPAVSRAFEHWLAPENFDADGRQRSSLAAWTAERLDGPCPLRRATAADLAAIVALQHEAYAPNRALLGAEPLPLRADYGDLLDRMEIWVRDTAEGLEGVLILDPRANDLLLWSVATAPGAQGRGLGRALVEAAEGRARALGRAAVRLYTGEKLEQNVAWYRRCGYAIERTEALADRTLIHFVKPVG
jgi:RimJ/RimL family protein N-acetyltransferase/ribosomal protein S18 acetylase RimI-like enzyme